MSKRESNQLITFMVSGVLALAFTVLVTVLSGCSNNTQSPNTANIVTNASIQALAGEGCLKLAHSRPQDIAVGLEDLSRAQAALGTGKVPYGEIIDMALSHVHTNPESMVVIQPAIDATVSQLGINGRVNVPVAGTQGYNAIMAGITGCRTGLIAGNDGVVKVK